MEKENDKPVKEKMSIQEYANYRGVSRQTIYIRLNLPDSEGDITVELSEKNTWLIPVSKNKHVTFLPKQRRNKVATK